MLTARQKQLLDFLRERCSERDAVSPTYDEMAEALGLASKSGVHRLIECLEERGFIGRLRRKSRAIWIIDQKPPADSYRCEHCGRLSPKRALKERV